MPNPSIELSPTAKAEKALPQRLASSELTAIEATEAAIRRMESTQPNLRAMTVILSDEAREAAASADRQLEQCRADATAAPDLCGMPITIKDCFDVVGTAATLGIGNRTKNLAEYDSPLVSRLRQAGAVLLGKTNVPQAMLLHCCDNPVFGRTLHPTDPGRGPGGSSGGEAAIVAAGGSCMGLASDLGGSIRQPAHACGLVGFKPTSRRLTSLGSHRCLQGMNAIAIDPGPIANTVSDADLMMRALVGDRDGAQPDELYQPWRDYRKVDVAKLTVVACPSDGWFAASPPCQRAVCEAAAALGEAGVGVHTVALESTAEAMRLYFGLVSADGFRSVRRLLRGNAIDWQIRRQGWFACLPRPLRRVAALGLRLFGQRWLADLLSLSGPRSADAYWQLTSGAKHYANQFWDNLDKQVGRRVDAVILPPHALPALKHGTALDLLPAASYCYLANLIGAPAGVVPWTMVFEDEQHYPSAYQVDLVNRLANHTMVGSAGLPIGVQVVARPWADEIALAVMAKLERSAS